MKRMLMIAVLIAAGSWAQAQSKHVLRVELENAKGGQGKCHACLFEQAEGFPTEPEKARQCLAAPVAGGKSTLVFRDLPTGTYAVAAYYDRNGNGKLDNNAFGIPSEPNAASNQAKGRFGPPPFDKASFRLAQAEQKIVIKFDN